MSKSATRSDMLRKYSKQSMLSILETGLQVTITGLIALATFQWILALDFKGFTEVFTKQCLFVRIWLKTTSADKSFIFDMISNPSQMLTFPENVSSNSQQLSF